MGLTLVTTNPTGTTMSVLRSLWFEEFTAVDDMGCPEDWKVSLHIANAGFGWEDCWIEMEDPKNSCGTSLNITQVRGIIEALNKFVKNYEWHEIHNCKWCGALLSECNQSADCLKSRETQNES